VAPVQPGQTGPITGKQYPAGLVHPDKNNFAPRVGLAWKPWQKTVVRAGYGVNYNIGQYGLMASQLGFQPPFAEAQINPAQTPTSLTLQNGFPAAINNSASHITNTYAVDPDYALAYVQSWNLNIQQEIKTSLVVNIGYTGAKGTHLDIVRAPDQLPTGGPRFTPCTPVTLAAASFVQPFLFESSQGSSILHQGTLRVRKRLRHGLSVGGTYTYSKSIDDASNFFSSAGDPSFPQNSYNVAAERGRSNFDVRHRLSVSYSYALPFGKGRQYLTNDGWLSTVVSGWETYGIVTVQSGRPFTVALLPEIDNSGTGRSILGFGANDRPNLVGNPELSNPTTGQWFNTAAFAFPAPGTFGNAGRNILDGPGYQTVNLSLMKNTALSERVNLQFRAEAFNLFNHPNFNLPDNFLGSPTFGRITSARDPRHIQFGLKLLF